MRNGASAIDAERGHVRRTSGIVVYILPNFFIQLKDLGFGLLFEREGVFADLAEADHLPVFDDEPQQLCSLILGSRYG
jgi:hypothetical protein